MKPLTPKIHNAIIYNKNCRQSGHTIAKQLECDKMVVYNVLKYLYETGFSIPKKKN